MKMKRILASILCVAMVLSTMGTVLFAEDGNTLYVDPASIEEGIYTTLAAAAAAAQDGDIIVLAAGEYDITGANFGTVTVKAADGAAVTIDIPDHTPTADLPHQDNNANVTFENVTLDFYPNGNYNGLQYNTVICNGCTINGQMFLYALTSDTFNNCIFNQNDSNSYNVWTYTSKHATFNGCTFNCAGKGLLVYNEGAASNVDIKDTDFIASEAVDGKAAIEISAYGGATFVTVDDETTADGFATGSKSENTLWNVKDNTTPNDTVVEVADEFVHIKKKNSDDPVVAMIRNEGGTKLYTSLTDAIADLEEGDTLKISSGTYDSFDVLVDNVTITGMTDDAEITINSITHNAFIGINANGVTVENLNFIVPENCVTTGDWMDMFDAVIGYWSNNFNSGSAGITGYDVKNCSFVNEGSDIGIAIFNFDNFEISGNTFENFNTGVTAMQDGSAMGAVAINDNTFTKVNEPVNVYWGQAGDDTDSLTLTGNSFVSAKDADEIKITIDDYAAESAGQAGISAIDLSGNTFGAATEVVLVDAAATVTTEATEDLANAGNVALTSKYDSAARIGNVYYADLHAAIEEAESDETVEVLKDVTVDTWNSIYPAENLTINGNNKTLTVNTVDSGINGGGLFLNATGLTIKDWTVNLPDTQNNSERPRLAIMNSGTLENITVNGGTHAVSVKGDVEITNCAFEGQSGWIIETENAPAEAALTIEDSTFAGKAVILRGQNNTFIGNTITNDGDGVNVLGDAVIIDNDFGESTLGIDTGVNVTVEKNIINDVEFTTWLGAEDYSNVTVENNKLSDAAVEAFNEKLEEEVASVEPPIEIDGEIYFTLTDAIAAAEQGAALTLVADAEITTADYNNIISKEITLTLGSYTLTASNALADTDFITVQNGYEVKKTRRDGVYVYSIAKRETTTTPDKYYSSYGGSMITTKKEEPKKNLSDFPFTDVKTDFWGYEGIAYCWQNNIMNGMTNTAFEPETPLSRAMLVTMLYRFAGSPKVTTTEKEWYSAARVWAMNSGISDGTNMNDTITREQLAAMLCRYASKKGKDTGTGADLTVFNDAANISGWAHTSVSWAVRNGLIKGMGNGTLSPNSGATRAEVATIMQRFIEFSK